MENLRGDLVVIVAGYAHRMNTFFLRLSRVPP
jgi:hypothetical protein